MPSSGVQTCALRSEEHTSELQSRKHLVCRLLLEKKTDALRRSKTQRRQSAGIGLEARDGMTVSSTVASWKDSTGWYRQRRPRQWSFFFNDTATPEIYTLSLTTLFRS